MVVALGEQSSPGHYLIVGASFFGLAVLCFLVARVYYPFIASRPPPQDSFFYAHWKIWVRSFPALTVVVLAAAVACLIAAVVLIGLALVAL